MAITDYFQETAMVAPTTLSAGLASGAATANLSSTTNFPTDTPVTITVDRYDTSTLEETGRKEVMYGIVSGLTLTNLVRGQDDTTDQAHSAGASVEILPTATLINRITEGILVSHDQDGTLKDNAVVTANITDLNITTAKIADDAVTAAKIADFAYDTDANGWLIYNIPGVQIWFKRYILALGTIAAGGSATQVVNWPVGLDINNAYRTWGHTISQFGAEYRLGLEGNTFRFTSMSGSSRAFGNLFLDLQVFKP